MQWPPLAVWIRQSYRQKRILGAVFLGTFFLTAICLVSLAQQAQPTSIRPNAEIDLSRLGFRGLPASARLAAQSNLSLDFLDDDHVLLTFNPKKMFTRHPDCPPTHDDRIIHAVVLSVPDGKVVREADWYLHDHERYLWNLWAG